MVPWLLPVLYFDTIITGHKNVFSLLTPRCKQAMGVVNYITCTHNQIIQLYIY